MGPINWILLLTKGGIICTRLHSKWADYNLLIKTRLSLTVVFTSLLGYSPLQRKQYATNCFGFAGSFSLSYAANAINEVLEKDFDTLMKRTMVRPLMRVGWRLVKLMLVALSRRCNHAGHDQPHYSFHSIHSILPLSFSLFSFLSFSFFLSAGTVLYWHICSSRVTWINTLMINGVLLLGACWVFVYKFDRRVAWYSCFSSFFIYLWYYWFHCLLNSMRNGLRYSTKRMVQRD